MCCADAVNKARTSDLERICTYRCAWTNNDTRIHAAMSTRGIRTSLRLSCICAACTAV